jgi:antirestriction protein ArdC
MKVEQAKQIASNAIDELSQALERGHSETLRNYLAAMARFHRYSLHNLILIVSQRPDATRVAGFHTWKQLGRNVQKGAKGIMILAPVVLRKNREEGTSEADESKAAVYFRAVYVFDQMDTEGKPLSELGSAQGDPAGYTERLKQFIAGRGIKLEYSNTIYPAQGQCSPGKIVLVPGQSAAEEYATLAHEAAHSLLHMQERRAETTKRVRETEAEAVAFVVCEAIGLKAENSADYIHLYSGDKETLAESLEHVQRASSEILAAILPAD